MYEQAINEGPGARIRTNAYKYRSQIDRELVIIRRIKELQLRFVGLFGSAIVASFALFVCAARCISA